MTGNLSEQVRAYVRQIEGIEDRLRYCFSDMIDYREDRGYYASRAFISAGRLIGRGQRATRRLAREIERVGSIDRLIAKWERIPAVKPQFPSLGIDEFGFVYLARLRDFPSIVKVGFSQDPHRRMKSLKSQTGEVHVLEHFEPGTKLSEAKEFLRRRNDGLWTEWFADPGYELGHIPPFLSMGFTDSDWRRAVEANRNDTSGHPNTMCAIDRIYLQLISEAA